MATVSLAEAQQAGKIYRVGILSQGFASVAKRNIDPFLQELRELGYIEGKNIVIEYRYGDRKVDRLPTLATELLREDVDVILVVGSRAIMAAKQATNKIPIVVGAAADDLVRTGVVASLARPGGNITGSTRLSTELGGKRLELLKETLSKASRVAVIVSTRQDREELKSTEDAASQLGVKIQPVDVRDRSEFQHAFADIATERADAVVILHSAFTFTHRKQLLQLAEKNRLPSMCEQAAWTSAGCLVSYGPDVPHLYRRAAIYVDKILKGRTPADLPVEQPTKFEFVINLKTAKEIGLTIPQSVLYRATKVIR